MKCNRDCFNCSFPDCVEDGVEYDDFVADRELESTFLFPQTLKIKTIRGINFSNHLYYERNKQKENERSRACQKLNRARLATYKRAYYEANKERCNAINIAYRERNKEKVNARKRAYYVQHKEQVLAANRMYKKKNKEMLAAYNRAHYKQNKEKRLAYCHAYYKRNKQSAKEVDDGHV